MIRPYRAPRGSETVTSAAGIIPLSGIVLVAHSA
nr:MAG TPA: hypothetical protein [Caudoviricetes sp.]